MIFDPSFSGKDLSCVIFPSPTPTRSCSHPLHEEPATALTLCTKNPQATRFTLLSPSARRTRNKKNSARRTRKNSPTNRTFVLHKSTVLQKNPRRPHFPQRRPP